MAFNLYRFFRFLRSICVPMAAIICFSSLLTFIFVLYQPTTGPGLIQRLGWQSWDTVSISISDLDGTVPTNPSTDIDFDVPEGVDWWNVTGTSSDDTKIDAASLPLDVWAPLLPHDTGLSEIAITRCMVSPTISGEMCAPASTSEKDAIKGKWVRVERNLNMQSGMWYLNIWYRRTRRQDIPLINSLRLLPEGKSPSPNPSSDHWHKVDLSIRDGVPRVPKLYLWYHIGKTIREMTADDRQVEVITELDVLFGEDVPWYGFEKLDPAITPEQEGRMDEVWLTYRRGVKSPPKAPPLHFTHEGRFKILQIADLHFSVSRGKCHDVPPDSTCTHSDNITSTLLGHVLDAEKPDLVVFSGDQLNGQGTSWDPKSVLAKFAVAATERGIPWAAIFGNHDDENGATKEEQMRMMQGLPYNLVEAGPKDVHGVGNYVLKVKSADASKTHLLTLYFLDSGSYSKGTFDWFGFWTPTAYDWIRQSQIDWFLQESGSIKPIERPFTPDTTKDLGDLWDADKKRIKRQSDQLVPQSKRLAKPNALMFFHIPLPESYTKADTNPLTGQPLDVGIQGLEGPSYAKGSDGFFEKGILKALESDHVAGGGTLEVKAVGNGHCHVTENCRRVKGVWLCFGGGGSYSGYGKIGFDRRFRIYDISNYGETIRTYKRTEGDEILDEMVLSGPAYGAP